MKSHGTRRIIIGTAIALMASAVVVVSAAVLFSTPICSLGDRRRAYTVLTIKDLGQALQEFRRTEGYYPEPDGWLDDLVRGGYLERLPVDPWWGEYQYTPELETFTVKSLGADGRAGGTGDGEDLDETFPKL